MDDEPDVLAVFEIALKRAGYEVAIFTDGAEALAAAACNDYQLAFLDVAMPTTDGVELLKQLRALCPRTQVVMITAFLDSALSTDARSARVTEALNLGARGCLRKPFSLGKIVETAEYFMG